MPVQSCEEWTVQSVVGVVGGGCCGGDGGVVGRKKNKSYSSKAITLACRHSDRNKTSVTTISIEFKPMHVTMVSNSAFLFVWDFFPCKSSSPVALYHS